MTPLRQDERRDRIRAIVQVAMLHALLGYALIDGLGFAPDRAAAPTLKLFDIAAQPPPPPPVAEARAARAEEPEGAASPPGLPAATVVAPVPEVRLELPPPVAAAPVPGPGSARLTGTSDIPGPGTGRGGVGTGSGSGGAGSGTGGGGGARAELERGYLANADYPRAAKRAGAEGAVFVRYTVGTDGRVGKCRVTRSSGSADLDMVTCRLIEQRFRYRPARDARGDPVPETIDKVYEWWLGR